MLPAVSQVQPPKHARCSSTYPKKKVYFLPVRYNPNNHLLKRDELRI